MSSGFQDAFTASAMSGQRWDLPPTPGLHNSAPTANTWSPAANTRSPPATAETWNQPAAPGAPIKWFIDLKQECI